VIQQIDLISPEYCKAQKAMHAHPRGYGGRGYTWAPTVIEVAKRYDAMSILDYGAGAGTLGKALREAGFVCRDYDPAIPGWDGPPSFADLVTCCDVLEHIEPDKLDNVLAHIRSLARKAVFLVIATRPANKLLPNGHNAHLTIENKQWWGERVTSAGFVVQKPPATLPEKMPGKGKCWMAVCLP
jgi:2-polyprenyl-3-methyl-5-hydroxy-6-metoxy-1,4-benzoquinol methylase